MGGRHVSTRSRVRRRLACAAPRHGPLRLVGHEPGASEKIEKLRILPTVLKGLHREVPIEENQIGGQNSQKLNSPPRAARAPLHCHAGSAGRAQLVRLPHVYRQHVPSARTCGCRARRPRSATRGLSRGPPYHSQHLRGPRVGPRRARGASLTCPLWSSSCLTCLDLGQEKRHGGPLRGVRARAGGALGSAPPARTARTARRTP